jgi:hypothetical protein
VKCLNWTAAVMAILLAGNGFAADLAAQDFAYGATIQTPGEAAAYRFALPVVVYQRIVHDNLSDLRVFNGQGESAPIRVALPPGAQAAPVHSQAVPLFPLHGAAAATLETLRITIGERGSTLRVQTQGTSADGAGAVRYVLDGRGVDRAVSAIVLQWPDGAADFAGKLLVEAGDTLGAWHTLIDAAPIANLHANGQQLIERRVQLPPTRARFWQLSWLGTPAPFALTGANVESADTAAEPAYARLFIAGSAVANHRGEFEFDLGAQAPIVRMNLELPALNSIVGAQVLSRKSVKDQWRALQQSVFYRLSGAAGELHNGPLEVHANSDRYWLVRISPAGNSLGAGILRLEAQWRAHELTFLARGGGPYQLAFGSGAVTSVGYGFDSLPTGTSIREATLGATQVLGGPERLQPPPTPFPWKSTVLWAILALGVALLAVMAYRLSRNVGGAPG